MALELLSDQAPSDITRASLARKAQVDPGLIRYYFKNRDSLMRAAAETLTDRLQARASSALAHDLSPDEQVCARVKALLAFKVDNPFYHRLMMEETARSGDPASKSLYEQIAGNAIARYASYLEAGSKDGSLRKVDAAMLYMAVIGLCDFFVIASPVLAPMLPYDDPEMMQQAYGDFICDLLINGLRPR